HDYNQNYEGIIHPNIRMIHYTAGRILFPIKGNYNIISRSDIHVVWFLYNLIPKNCMDVVLSHMIERKRKNNIFPYAELITITANFTSYPFGEEEPIIQHIKMGQPTIRKMGFTVQQGEFVAQQLRRTERRNTLPSNSSEDDDEIH
ncbi:hypothetical protein RYX36_034199, partial [Vicia faba]